MGNSSSSSNRRDKSAGCHPENYVMLIITHFSFEQVKLIDVERRSGNAPEIGRGKLDVNS